MGVTIHLFRSLFAGVIYLHINLIEVRSRVIGFIGHVDVDPREGLVRAIMAFGECHEH